MKNSSKFLERICKRMRSRRTRSNSSKDKKRSDVHTSKVLSKVSSPMDTSRSPSSVAISEKPTASWGLELAGGAFQDSKVTVQTRPCPMAAPSTAGCFSSPPARTDRDSHAIAASSSAPLLQVQSAAGESTELSGLANPKQTSIPPKAKIGTELTPGKEVYMLSATDSGLYSEEEGASEDEYLDVFSEDEEEEDDVVDDGWLIPADEVSLDKVVATSHSETVYR